MKTILTLLLVAAACVGCRMVIVRPTPLATPASGPGITVQFAWDPSTDNPSNVVITNYILYLHTNSLYVVDRSQSVYKVNAGTNLTAFVAGLQAPSTWWAGVSAQGGFEPPMPLDGTVVMESELSNIAVIAVPNPPLNNKVVIEYGMTVTNFTDQGYFRLRIVGPP